MRAYSALSDEEADAQRRVVEAFEEAESRGVASLRVDGRFVDYPIYRLAKRPHRALRRLARRASGPHHERAARSTACASSTPRRCSPAP